MRRGRHADLRKQASKAGRQGELWGLFDIFTPDLLSWSCSADVLFFRRLFRKSCATSSGFFSPTHLKIMTTPLSFEAFETAALTRGFDEVQPRSWTADAVVENHTHPFAVKALVVQGEMWLTVDAATRHLLPGDTFELTHALPHSERYGAEGATYWAARRHGVPTPSQ